nr:unnamed protein product [Spirometra erinaceieuropaei]
MIACVGSTPRRGEVVKPVGFDRSGGPFYSSSSGLVFGLSARPPPHGARTGHLDAPSIATLAPAGLCRRPETRPAGCSGDKGDPACRKVDQTSSRHLQDAGSPSASQGTSSNELAQSPTNLPFVVVAADENASVENR